MGLNSLLDDKILDFAKLEAFGVDKSNNASNDGLCMRDNSREKKSCVNEWNAGFQLSLLFSSMFSQACYHSGC